MDRTAIKDKAIAWAGLIMDGLLPRHCVMCGTCSGAQNLCLPCAAELPRNGHACQLCALPLVHPADRICGHCLAKTPPWTSTTAALLYRFPVDQLVCRFKFGRNLPCGQILGREMIHAVRYGVESMPDCIIPVPLHRSRHFLRAFNQADLLARQLGKELGIPVHGSFLRRCRHTRAHSGLDAASRRKNIRGAFACKAPASRQAMLQHVALVDDVMTTGATLSECTRVLKKAGAANISVWVAARAPETW